jgi:hypothetical protein
MNVTVINNGQISCPINITSLTTGLVLEDMHLGIDPDGVLLEQLSLVRSQIVAWADITRLLFAVPEGMVVKPNWQDWGSYSDDSQALYPACWDLSARRRGGVLLQILPPRSYTSWHFHDATRETFYPLYGESRVKVNDHSARRLRLNDQVAQTNWHQLMNATDRFAINLIHMESHLPFLDGTGRPNMSDHHYD